MCDVASKLLKTYKKQIGKHVYSWGYDKVF